MSDLAQRLANLTPAQRKLLEQRMAAGPKPTAEPIAIVGMSCRFAGARSLADYWRVIREGIEATSEVSPLRWDIDELYDPTGTQSGKMSTRWGGFVDDIDQFDPQFFGIAPREAARMDPQQRLLLEVAWETLENAGHPADRMGGTKTAVFVGIGGTDYSKVPSQFVDYYHHIDAHVGTGNALSIAANRVSYIFDFHGPSAAVDTACSSSSLAIHMAVESLRRKESDAALAGGVNAIITPETTIAFSKARMLSPEGKCRPFDSRANGYVRGEGCGLVMLKRLADAQRDGDHIIGILRATSVNQDGRTSGISAPNGQSQQECIRAALVQAGIKPGDISYIEAHGTGTPLGDPIEMQALVELFQRAGESDPPLYVTSVKANIGHTETVSGVAGLIKTLLLMQHETIVPQLHLETLNPHISLAGSRIVVPTAPAEWPSIGTGRFAGISSFGFGGTNTHLIVEAPPRVARPAMGEETTNGHLVVPRDAATVQHPRVVKLSGRTASALKQQASALRDHLVAQPNDGFEDVAFTANTGRADFNHRVALVCDSRESLQAALELVNAGKSAPQVKHAQVKGMARPKVAMLFTGQGSQYPQMGRELYDTEPIFRQVIDECDEVLHRGLNESLLSILFPGEGDNADLVNETVYTQPALFAIEYAVAKLWQSRGVEPSLLLGHSIGEYVAATLAGCMKLEEGLGLVAERARLMQQVSRPGKMAVLFAPESQVIEAIRGLEDRVAIAAVNGPQNTVLSGEALAVDQLVETFRTAGIEVQPLTVSHAFHSPLMDEMLDDFEQFSTGIDFQPPRIPIVSNLTGQVMTEAPTPKYWREHVRSAVRFVDGIDRLMEEKCHILLEVGPSASLLGMCRRAHPEFAGASIASLRKGQGADATFATATAELYTAGAHIDWNALDSRTDRRRVLLPNYPFERDHYWFDLSGMRSGGKIAARTGGHPLLGARVPTVWSSTLFEGVLDTHALPYLADHQVQGSVVVPGAAFLEQGLSAAKEVFGDGRHAVTDVAIQAAMFLHEGHPRLTQVSVEPEAGGRTELNSYSTSAEVPGEWTGHASATLVHESQLPPRASDKVVDFEEHRSQVIDSRTRDSFYEIIAARGLKYGPQFQVLDDVERSRDAALARVVPHEQVVAELARYQLHPVLGDACLQTLASTVPLEPDGNYSPFTYMPVGVRQLRIVRPIENFDQSVWCYAIRRSEDESPSPEFVESDVFLVDGEGRVFVEMLGARVQRIGRPAASGLESRPSDWLYHIDWHEHPLATASEPAAGTWLILADAQVGSLLASRLKADDRQLLVVKAGNEFKAPGNLARGEIAEATIVPGDREQLVEIMSLASASDSPLAGVLYLWPLDLGTLDSSAVADDDWHRSRLVASHTPLQLLQQLGRLSGTLPRLWFATSGAQTADELADVAVTQAPLVGLARVAAVEQVELRPTLVDLDPASGSGARGDQLLAEISHASSTDSQIAYRGNRRFVARLTEDATSRACVEASGGGSMIPDTRPYQLRITTAGSFDALRYVTYQPAPLAPGEVQFEVRATGLNFSDVLKALGLYPGIKDKIVPLGIEASGVVTAVGEGVDRFKVGDEVMGVAPYAFASHATTREYTLVKKPASLTHEEAATVPITFLTAWYALARLAHIERGERVLIHAAAGGVGLAAIQICQHLGAEVYATAGSPEKHEFLRSLGVKHIYSSRSLDFAEQILDDTGREGVDVVLNSLPGEAITKSLGILRAHGRFLEIGKTDIYQNRKIGLLPFQDNLSYHAIDLDRMLRHRPETIRTLFAEVMEHFNAGHFHSERFTTFAAEATIDAFRYMSQRKNIGKVVVSFAPVEAESQTPRDDTTQQLIRCDGSYLITGGLGGLGLQLADWLASEGAGGLLLMARSVPTPEKLEVLQPIRDSGCRVEVVQGDVLDRASLKQALGGLPKDFPPLRGVIHAAGVLADGMLTEMTPDQFDRAMLPKTVGAWNLHHATLGHDLDHFVLFSSVAATLGSPGQGNYAAGNATLDALAHARRRHGLPALSINWGPWAGSGMAADTFAGKEGEASSQGRGMGLLPADAALGLLGRLMSGGVTQTTVMDVAWGDLLKVLGNRCPSILCDIAETHGAAIDTHSQVDHEFRGRLEAAEPDDQAAMVRDYIQAELARILSFEPDQLDVDQPLTAFGLDSLMALELKNNLEGRLSFNLPMAKLLEGPSIASLAADTVKLILGDGAQGKQAAVDQEWQPLVELRSGTGGAPFVILPALGGDVSCYAELVPHLDKGRPVVAFRPRGLDDSAAPHQSMQEMVADYATALRRLQPQGPYHLMAWSAGGITAFALAEYLLAEGEQVEMLALFDTALPSAFAHFDVDDPSRFLIDMVHFTNRFAGTRIELSLDDIEGSTPEERFADAVRQAREQGIFSAAVKDDYIHHLVGVGAGMVKSIQSYTPRAIATPMHLFLPEIEGGLEELTGLAIPPGNGWQSGLGQKVVETTIPGDHFSMLQGEGARALASEISRLTK